jgi:hypothetical protein
MKKFTHNGFSAAVTTVLDESGYAATVTCDDGEISRARAATALGARRIAMRLARDAGMRPDTTIADEIHDARTAAYLADHAR